MNLTGHYNVFYFSEASIPAFRGVHLFIPPTAIVGLVPSLSDVTKLRTVGVSPPAQYQYSLQGIVPVAGAAFLCRSPWYKSAGGCKVANPARGQLNRENQ